MDTIEFTLAYPAPLGTVAEAYWRAERWPGLTGHVTGIDIHFEDEHTQVLTMQVDTRGHRAAFRTVRCRQRNRIYYFQPAPPPFLLTHRGYWQFDADGEGCTVTRKHEFRVDEALATRFATDVLGWDCRGPVAGRIGELLCANSRQTMEALRTATRHTTPLPAMG